MRMWTRIATVILVIFAVLHVIATLSASQRLGRLAMVPVYDDVDYLIDGIRRLRIFDEFGLQWMAVDIR